MTLDGWLEMAIAFVLFLASHGLPARPAVRRRLAGAPGEGGYLAVYSIVALLALGWLIVAAGRAPYVEVWAFAPWQLWAPNLAMPLVCLLVAFGVAAPSPLSFAVSSCAGPPLRLFPERNGQRHGFRDRACRPKVSGDAETGDCGSATPPRLEAEMRGA
jgi:hypothetical protein